MNIGRNVTANPEHRPKCGSALIPQVPAGRISAVQVNSFWSRPHCATGKHPVATRSPALGALAPSPGIFVTLGQHCCQKCRALARAGIIGSDGFGKFRSPLLSSPLTWAAHRPQPKAAERAQEVKMAQIYFHCSTPNGLIVDRRGSQVNDINEACDRAEQVVQTLIAGCSPEDWRTWILHVTDDDGEIFALPFSSGA